METLSKLDAAVGLLTQFQRDATNIIALCHTMTTHSVGPGVRQETLRLFVPLLESHFADTNATLLRLRDVPDDDRTRTVRRFLVTAGAAFAQALRIIHDDLNETAPPVVRLVETPES